MIIDGRKYIITEPDRARPTIKVVRSDGNLQTLRRGRKYAEVLKESRRKIDALSS
jgi:hypothetical protein